jgi:hypothetical protein
MDQSCHRITRRPFDLPSGCDKVVVPSLTLPSVCSMPSLTYPGVSPRPVVFNIPELPNVPVEQACIDINLTPSIMMSSKDGDATARMTFGTASGYDDCLEGRYSMGLRINLPCLLSRIPKEAGAEGEWNDRKKPSIRMSVAKDPSRCDIDSIGFKLDIPCPLPSRIDGEATFKYAGRPKMNMVVKRKPLARGECAMDSMSIRLDIPAGCGGISFTKPSGAVGMRMSGTAPSIHVDIRRQGSGKDGSKPEACAFKFSMNLMIPPIGPGCDRANYTIVPSLHETMKPMVKTNISTVSRNVPAGKATRCNFNVSFRLDLGTAALHPCLGFDADGRVDDSDISRTAPSFHMRQTKPSGAFGCSMFVSFILELPRLQITRGDLNIDMGDVDIDIDNGPNIDITNNIRKFSINLKLPKLVCLPRDVLTISRVQMKFFKDNNIRERLWRHVSVSKASCIRKRVRKYPGRNSMKPQYVMTCVTQCSRTVNTSVKLPWWMYRGNTKNGRNRTIEYARNSVIRARRGIARAPGDGGPDDQNIPACEEYMGRISIRASLNDFENDPGSADISVWMTLPCPGDMFDISVRNQDNPAGIGPDLVARFTRGDCCSIKLLLGMPVSGIETRLTRYTDFKLNASGFIAKSWVDYYRKGMLYAVSFKGTRKLFAADGCN